MLKYSKNKYGTHVRRWTCQRVLSEVEVDHGRHEAELVGQHRDPVAAHVQEGQLEVRDFWKRIVLKLGPRSLFWFAG